MNRALCELAVLGAGLTAWAGCSAGPEPAAQPESTELSAAGEPASGDRLEVTSCTPGRQRCVKDVRERCTARGVWGEPWTCATGACALGACAGATTAAPSCAAGGPGLADCGPSGESCCTSLEVLGGTFDRTYSAADDAGAPGADPATVAGFRLDKYPVTVGRFRQFVSAWSGGSGYLPAPGSGKHVHVNKGEGLANAGPAGGFETGWSASDDSHIAPTSANLACYAAWATWTPAAGDQEQLPINCVNSYEAQAFCIWDGGFLPSEAEWEYAAAGGREQRLYPWGSTDPGTSSQYAVYGCFYQGSGSCSGIANLAPRSGPAAGGRSTSPERSGSGPSTGGARTRARASAAPTSPRACAGCCTAATSASRPPI